MSANEIKPGWKVAINTKLTGNASAIVVSVHPDMKTVTVLVSEDDGVTEQKFIIRDSEVKYKLPLL